MSKFIWKCIENKMYKLPMRKTLSLSQNNSLGLLSLLVFGFIEKFTHYKTKEPLMAETY